MRRAALILLLARLAASWGFGALMVRPSPTATPPAAAPAIDVALKSKDGLAIAATYHPGRSAIDPAVLLLHGNNASRGDRRQRRVARGPGLRHPCHRLPRPRGVRDGPHSFGYLESRPAAALRWLKAKQRGAPVGVIGISLGGASVLLVGARGAQPDALILQAVYPDIRHAIRNRNTTITGSVPAALLEPLLGYQSRLRYGAWPSELAPIARVRDYRAPCSSSAAARIDPPRRTKPAPSTPPRRALSAVDCPRTGSPPDLRTRLA